MDRNIRRNGLINLLALALVGAGGYAMAEYAGTWAGTVAMYFVGLGVLVAAVSWFQMRLEERERLEKLDFDELSKSAKGTALFNVAETEVFPAQRSREQFERFFVPGFTVVLFLLQLAGAIVIWRRLAKVVAPSVTHEQLTVALGLFALLALLLFVLGKYSTNLARLSGLRLLRPGATYLLLSGYLCGVVALSIVPTLIGFPSVDLYVARVFVGILFLTGLETLLSLTLELYRPRMKGKVERPLYESRLVSLLGQPEGLITTAAQTLDYQFGFKVSETWAYRLFERWLPWFVLGQAAVLLVSTTVVFIDAGEKGVLEHFGKPVGVLEPGAHFKYPWPIDQVHRYSAELIQSFDVGFTPDESAKATRTVLWTVPHSKEENFLVASRESVPITGGTNGAVTAPPPVSLLTVSIPVQFQISNLTNWVYLNEEPDTLLKDIANREVVRYLVSVNLQEVMSHGRADATRILRERIQAEADRHQLGANIIFVGLQDIHPPVKVAPDYEKVVTALHAKESSILTAQAEALRTNAYAVNESAKIVSEADSERKRVVADTTARAALFTNQIPAFLASPSIYKQRAYLQMFTESITNSRKYVILATNTQDIVILNLEDKIRQDLLEDIILPATKK